jgi:hypothetical protein
LFYFLRTTSFDFEVVLILPKFVLPDVFFLAAQISAIFSRLISGISGTTKAEK